MTAELLLRPAARADAARLHDLHTASVRTPCAPHYAPDIVDGWLVNRRPESYLPEIGAAVMRRALEMAARGHAGSIRLERFGFRELRRATIPRDHVAIPIVLMERSSP